MLRLTYISLAFLSLFTWSAQAKTPEAKQPQIVCPDRVMLIGDKIKFTALEKIFLCGDPDSAPWSHIPLAQAKFHMRNFLQDRGYHHPQFREEGDALIVETGAPTKLKKIEVISNPPFTEMHRRRQVIGRKLTPGLLNSVENWIRGQLRDRGHPCPELISRADPDTGVMEVYVDPGEAKNVESVIQEAVPGLGTGTLRRFDAFLLGHPFKEKWLDLTSRRVEESGVLQASYFSWDCPDTAPLSFPESAPSVESSESESSPAENSDMNLFQRTFAGKPRLFRLGFGADTEEYAIFRLSWKHLRWGSNASSFQVSMYASYIHQDLELSADWHAFAPLSRWFLRPAVSFTHRRDSEFHYLTTNAKFGVARTWDNQEVGLRMNVGPNLNYTYTFRGAEPGWTRFLTVNYEMELMSHAYEYWQTDPRTGYQVKLAGDFGNRNTLSDITAQRFALEGKYLYNFRDYDPPLLIFAVRGGLYGTWLADGSDRNKLPPNYRFFLGGSRNLRGFDLDELPQGFGALSAAFVSTEVRLANKLPLWLQPLVFFDIGVLGDQAFHFNLPVYFSPGFGLRVASPIGVFRTTFGFGLKSGDEDAVPDNTHFQFFIGYGEEF